MTRYQQDNNYGIFLCLPRAILDVQCNFSSYLISVGRGVTKLCQRLCVAVVLIPAFPTEIMADELAARIRNKFQKSVMICEVKSCTCLAVMLNCHRLGIISDGYSRFSLCRCGD